MSERLENPPGPGTVNTDSLPIPSPRVGAARPTKYSVVIPVYNSADVVSRTIERVVSFFRESGLEYEIVLVNDGSTDQSWEVVRDCASRIAGIVAVNLLHNYGQHTAVLCGFEHASGDYVVTLDDDLQNPPEEIRKLIDKAAEGHDVVFGRYERKQHAGHRRIGSVVIGMINTLVFKKPKDLVLTNFRILRRDVIDRMCAHRTVYPYIQGLALMFAANPANVWVKHERRQTGKSNYTAFKIVQLVGRILFSYSLAPLRVLTAVGGIVALASFLLGLYYLVHALFFGTRAPGWATTVVLLSFYNGITILLLSMLGEYTVRLLNQTSAAARYHVREVLRSKP